MTTSNSPSPPTTLRIITLNCWGLKYLSPHRHLRLSRIGHELATANPTPHLVALQECWTQQDFHSIHASTQHLLPHAKFYFSGIFGGGLAILSKYPFEETTMYRYPLNGRPSAFYRGDWFVGKGVACARVRFGTAVKDVLEVFCTHLHAPYEEEPNDSYVCHRTAQAWEIARLMRGAGERGHVVLGLGDFNMVPGSLAYRVVEAHGGVRDVWGVVKAGSEVGKGKEREGVTVEEALGVHGTTCDSVLNTWRWSKKQQRELRRGKDRVVGMEELDPNAKRLDYIFFAPNREYEWSIEEVEVGMTMRHSELKCSLSDHFSVEMTLRRASSLGAGGKKVELQDRTTAFLPLSTYDAILDMIHSYTLRERRQRRLRLSHFGAQFTIAVGCLIAVWWSPRPFVAFILMLISTLGLSAGVIDGLMGGLFVGSELRALKEFEYEITNARRQAAEQEIE